MISTFYINIINCEDYISGQSDLENIYASEPCIPLKKSGLSTEANMAGGRLAYDDSGYLYLANGDYGIDEYNSDFGVMAAQDQDWQYGKVIKIDISDGTTEIVSFGHRNPQGMTFDNEGRLWLVEHGPRGGDELNMIESGANYGWPLVSYGTSYSSLPVSTIVPGTLGHHDGFEEPALAFLPSVAPGSLIVSRGFHPLWEGDLLIGTLASGLIIRVRIAPDSNRVVFAERIAIGERLRDLEISESGELFALTDSRKILVFENDVTAAVVAELQRSIRQAPVDSQVAQEAWAVFSQCIECHSVECGDHRNAPSLASVFGSRAGMTGFQGYTSALSESNITWNRQTLAEFIRNPESVVPGTSMAGNLVSDSAIAILIDMLEMIGD